MCRRDLVVMEMADTYRRMAGFGKLIPPMLASLRRDVEACNTHILRLPSDIELSCLDRHQASIDN